MAVNHTKVVEITQRRWKQKTYAKRVLFNVDCAVLWAQKQVLQTMNCVQITQQTVQRYGFIHLVASYYPSSLGIQIAQKTLFWGSFDGF